MVATASGSPATDAVKAMNDIRVFLRFGALAGLAGGGAAALFQLLVTEGQIERALALEAAKATEPVDEMFSRGTQIVGGAVAAVVLGLLLGVVFAVVAAALWPRLPGRSVFGRAGGLAAAAFVGWTLIPALKYPPNPPGVGNADTVGQRTGAYVALLVVGLILLYLALELWQQLTARGLVGASRFAVVAFGFLAVVAVLYLVFPANPDPVDVPANLIWHFRLDSLASNALLWLVVGTAFGYLGDRRTRAEQAAPSSTDPLRR